MLRADFMTMYFEPRRRGGAHTVMPSVAVVARLKANRELTAKSAEGEGCSVETFAAKWRW